MTDVIADLIEMYYSGEITYEQVGDSFANLLSENTGRPRVQRCIEQLRECEA